MPLLAHICVTPYSSERLTADVVARDQRVRAWMDAYLANFMGRMVNWAARKLMLLRIKLLIMLNPTHQAARLCAMRFQIRFALCGASKNNAIRINPPRLDPMAAVGQNIPLH